MATLTTDERRAILEKEIRGYVGRGFQVMSRTDTTAQLVKKKSFNFLVALICLVLAVLPFILYLLIYMAAKDESVYLEVDEQGRVRRR